jgi:hypothetical protein
LKLLGTKVRDVVTGFVGIVTSVSFDLYGCVQAVVVTVGARPLSEKTVPSVGENLSPTSIKWVTSVTLDDSATPQARTWHWPEREA